MATIEITKTAVDRAVKSATTTFLWDTKEKGFGVRITSNGVRSYVYQYRLGGREARTRRHTIGKHGSPWTPDTARKEARRLAHLVAAGIDPIDADRERRRQAIDLAFSSYVDLFHERYLKPNWKRADYAKAMLTHDAVPILQWKPLPEIRRSDLARVFDAMSDRPAMAKLMHSTLRKLFRWAVGRGDLERSPLDGAENIRAVPARDRVLNDEELALAWAGAAKLGNFYSAFFRLLILTGQRRQEVAGIDWSELSHNAQTWTIPSERSKNGLPHEVPLSPEAMAVINSLAGDEAWPRKGLIFTTTGKTPISGFGKLKQRLDAAMNEIMIKRAADAGEKEHDPVPPWRVHDLRRTVATGLQRLEVRFEVTEAVLNHVSGARSGVAGVYQRYDWKHEKREALIAWGASCSRYG